jgi:hypothetical protein
MKHPAFRLVLLGFLGAATAFAAYETGGFAFTKRVETILLTEPKPLAAPVAPAAKLPFARKVKIEEVRGSWMRVSDGPKAAGWVFAGNLTATKPSEGKGTDGLGLSASKTTATAAARPLTPAASEYADRRQLTDARDDLDWLLEECRHVTPADVEAFLQEKKKGEYQ